MSVLAKYDSFKINPNSITFYSAPVWSAAEKSNQCITATLECEKFKKSKAATISNLTDGFLSPMAASRLRNRIKNLFWLSGAIVIHKGKLVTKSQNKISFVTLTLSAKQFHSDNYIKAKMLNQFISELRLLIHDFNYIWRAEKQANGNIHFHLLIGSFVPWIKIRDIWNRIQKKEGYVQKYHDKFVNISFSDYCQTLQSYDYTKINEYKQAYAYGNSTNWMNPNSIDAHGMKKVKNIFAYLSKYLSKNHSKSELSEYELASTQKIEGRIYFCSSSISRISSFSGTFNELSRIEIEKILVKFPDCLIVKDFFSILAIAVERLFNAGFKLFYFYFICNLNYLKL